MMDFMEMETMRRAKNLVDSLLEPEPYEDETYSIARALGALYARHMPGFPLKNAPRWEDSLERCEHVKLKRRYESLGQDFAEGDLLVPSWAWQRASSQNSREMKSARAPRVGTQSGLTSHFTIRS